jgi:hypothetical protein
MTVSTTAAPFTYPGTVHNITLNEPNGNVTPGPGNDIVTITITNLTTSNSDTLNLLEGASPGIFSGTYDNSTAPVSLQANQQIRFRYVDTTVPIALPNPSNVDRVFNSIATNATLTVNPATGTPGTNFTVTVNDLDRNRNAGGGNDTLTISVTNLTQSPGAPVTYTLNETSTPGNFNRVISNIDPPLGIAPSILPTVGDTVQVAYDDVNTFGANVFRTANHQVVATTANSLATLTVTSSAAAGFTYPGTTHTITLVDAGGNVTVGPGNDTVTLQIDRLSATNVVEATTTITLNETVTAGVFSATYLNTDAPISLTTNKRIRFRFIDTTVPPSFTNPTNVDVVYSAISTNGTITVNPATGTPGTNLVVTINDLDLNLKAGGGNDTVVISATNITTGLPNPVLFTVNETTTPGNFNITLTNVDARLDDTGGTIPNVGDTLRFAYDDVDTTGATVFRNADHKLNGTNGTLSVTPLTVSPGGSITVTIVDIDENRTPGPSNDQFQIALVNNDVGLEEIYPTVKETATPGTFTGTFFLSEFATHPVGSGPFVVVRYNDNGTSAGGGIVVRTVNVTIRGTDGVLSVSAKAPVGGKMVIRVADLDENTTPLPDSFTVDIYDSTCAGPSFPVLLTETANNSGLFEAIIDVDTIGFGVLAAGTVICTEYDDLANAAGVPAIRTGKTTIGAGTDATLSASPPEINPATNFVVTINDPDANVTPGGSNDFVTFTVENITIGSVPVTLIAKETATPGVFQATVNSGDNGLNSRVGHRIRVRYIDLSPATGVTKTLEAFVNIVNLVFGADATITATDTIPGRPITVEVRDNDFASATEVRVTAQNITISGTVETITLPSVGSGVFRGDVPTGYGTAPDGVDGVIEVKDGDVVRFSYADDTNSTGKPRTITADSKVNNRRNPSVFCDKGTETSNPNWFEQYYATRDLSGGVVVEAAGFGANFNWAETAPYRQLPADGWSLRLTTTIRVPTAARFRFRVGADDGVRLFINDGIVIDQFVPAPFRAFTADVNLAAGEHRIRIEFFEDNGNAGLLAECTFIENPVAAIDSSGRRVDVFPSEVNLTGAVAHITTGRINVRANPTVEAARIAYVFIYERYQIVGITDDGRWYLIVLRDGRTGWVSAQFVRRYEENPVQIYPSFASSESELPNVEVAGFAVEELVIRTAPRTGEQIGLLPKGAAFRVIARSPSGAWYRISFEGLDGWVYAPFVELTNGTVNDLPRQ